MRTLFLAALMLSGCASPMAMSGRLGGDWQALDINGVPVSGSRPITLRLDGMQASGKSGCNSYSGPVQLRSREGIEFGSLAVTEMACAPEVMEQENRYLSILRSVQGYSSYSDRGISLIAADGRAIRFRRPS